MRRNWLVLAPILAVVVFGDCSDPSEVVRFPSVFQVTSGDNQSAFVGQELAEPLVATLLDSDGDPVEGWIIIGRVTGGGSVTAPSGATNADGAFSSRWTLGTDPSEDQLLSVQALNIDGSVLVSVTFRATGIPGPVDTLVSVAGHGQAAPVATAVTALPVVAVLDPYDNVVPGVAVTFSVTAGGGTVTDSVRITGSDGTATIGSWTMGTVVGENRLTALIVTPAPAPSDARSASLRDLTVDFTATALPGDPAGVVVVGGDRQSANVGTQVAESLSVRVTDLFDNAVPGESVLFAVAGDGSLSATVATTDADGLAWTEWTLGTDAAMAQAVDVSLPNAPGVAGVSFAATSMVGPPTALEIVGGNGQTAIGGEQLSQRLVVRATDQFDNPVPGTDVVFTVESGGGSVGDATVASDGDGLAQTTWTVGPTVGQQTVKAELPSGTGTGSSVVFTATTVPGSTTALTVVSGNGQSGEVGAQVAESLVVRVSDAFGNAVPGEPVLFTVAGGGSLSVTTDTTGADGLAWTDWTLGTDASVAQTVDVTLPNASGVTGVGFAATPLPGPPTTIEVVGGNGQTAIAGEQLPQPLVVKATDQFDNPVPGKDVLFTVESGGGSVGAASVATDGDGMAQTTWTTGSTVGQQTVQAELAGATGAGRSVLFDAVVSSPLPPAGLAKVDGDDQSGSLGSTLPVPLQVLVTDANGNPVAGAAVDFAPSAGTVDPASGVSDATGLAATQLTLPPSSGAVTVSATVGALEAVFNAFAIADPTGSIQLSVDWPGPAGVVGDTFALVVEATSPFEVTAMRATVADRSVLLSFQSGRWRGALELLGLASGPHWLNLIATDATGGSVELAIPIAYDNPPVIEVLPFDYPFLRPNTRVRAMCADLEGTCSWRVRIGGSDLATADGDTLDVLISSSQTENTLVDLWVFGMDNSGQEVGVKTTMLVETSTHFTVVERVPDNIIEMDANRILFYVRSPAGDYALWLRDRTTGVDQLIVADANRRADLTDFGVVFATPTAVQEWVNGVTTTLAAISAISVSVDDPYVLAGTGSGLFVIHRQNGILYTNLGGSHHASGDVAANGDVVYSGCNTSDEYGECTPVYRIRNGITEQIGLGYRPQTDGQVVVYSRQTGRFASAQNQTILVTDSGTDSLTNLMATGTRWIMRGSWVAYERQGPGGVIQLWTRSPAGETRQATFSSSNSDLRGLGENGEVVYENPEGSYFGVAYPYSGAPIETDARLDDVFWIDGKLYLSYGTWLLEVR